MPSRNINYDAKHYKTAQHQYSIDEGSFGQLQQTPVTGLARRQQEFLYTEDQPAEGTPRDHFVQDHGPLTGRLSLESPPLQASPQTPQYLEADR